MVLLSCGAALGYAPAAWAVIDDAPPPNPTLVMVFAEQPPVLNWNRETQQPYGPLVDTMTRVAARAGLTLVWQEPWTRRRLLTDLDAGRQPLCTLNWALTPDRARRFKFTDPLGPAPDWVLVVRASDPRIGANPTPADLLARPDLVFGFSDGSWADERYVQAGGQAGGQPGGQAGTPDRPGAAPAPDAPNRERVRGGQSTLVAMVAKGRIDFALINRLALDRMLAERHISPADLRTIPAPDAGPSQPGRVMCTQSTASALIDRLNQAIAEEARVPLAGD
ncbi:transporter substrate-binding domain-containing protein [Nitrospirillum sp. BR 11164]|uniref:substrate-binding periplasmic protein n=1 Tax=Nitrospirillum sp. BR 11164 TaxID=3104324 RepID=UPI002B003ACC|nr:transporter substrate-binding domain-containing protein [Nitrospirillum sp. BR 11164]MEA1651745.1 transporter substrate-binding domain-containing protein [Nitrospirillum sp. BR 11164]